jgi:uncharacterized protein (TIGR03435 family)
MRSELKIYKVLVDKVIIRNYLLFACFTSWALAITPFGIGLRAGAQTAPPKPSFEVATIKPVIMDASHPFNPRHFWAHVSQTRASYWSMTLGFLITYAYDVHPFEVISPEWANADRFDIEATIPEGADKQDDRRMLQVLLKDRFKLAFHIEQRELEGYVLVVGKHGARLKPSLPDPANPAADVSVDPGDSNAGEVLAKSKVTRNQDGSSTVNMGKRGIETFKFDQENWATHYEYSKMTMEDLARKLNGCLGSGVHNVEDQTGIKGTYQVAYDCPLGAPRPSAGRDVSGALPLDPQDNASLIRSLDALGLKLEKHKAMREVYVIDHVERPSEN